MALILSLAFKGLSNFAEAHTEDSIIAQWPLMRTPVPFLMVTAAYLLFVFKVGPVFMRHRQPFELKTVLLVYNVAQILANLYAAIEYFRVIHWPQWNQLGCIDPLPMDHPHKITEINLTYLYMLLKVLDYMDTVFFVLRKSYKQITFLHVYHHILMVSVFYCWARYYREGGHYHMVGQLNTIVHVIMYTYYLMSALQPQIKHSKWKRIVTNCQLLQFVLLGTHQAWPLVMRRDCAFPKFIALFNVTQCAFMIALFGDFYVKAYKANKRRRIGKDEKDEKDEKAEDRNEKNMKKCD